MIKNIKISLALIVAFVVIIIASSILISAQSKSPKGVNKIETFIEACEAKSANKIVTVVDTNSINKNTFSDCVTVDDYLSKCNIRFNIKSTDTIKDVYLIGTLEYEHDGENSDLAIIEEISSYFSANLSYKYIVAYIGIDYVDENGEERSKVTNCVFVINDKNGKINSIR